MHGDKYKLRFNFDEKCYSNTRKLLMQHLQKLKDLITDLFCHYALMCFPLSYSSIFLIQSTTTCYFFLQYKHLFILLPGQVACLLFNE